MNHLCFAITQEANHNFMPAEHKIIFNLNQTFRV